MLIGTVGDAVAIAILISTGGAPAAAVDPVASTGNLPPIATTHEDHEVATLRSLFTAWKTLDAPVNARVSLPSQRPVDSFRYTSPFGVRADPFKGTAALHTGIDLAAPIGTPVHATADAVVSRAGVASGYGNLVQLDHGAGIQTRYGHLSRILVAVGQVVHKGAVVGLVGSTGRSTGSHLHYEMRVAGRAIDPLPYMAPGDDRLALRESVGPVPGSATAMGGPGAAIER